MTERDIDGLMVTLREAVDQQDEKLAVKVGLELLGGFLKTLVRIAEVLEK